MSSLQIPVKIEDVESILDTEFEADFSQVSFDNISKEKQLDTAFLYFRNTGFSFKPDFSKCTDQQIADVLKTYITTEYDVPNKYLQLLWIKLVLHKANADVEDDILSAEQTNNVAEILKDLVDELASFILSLPVYGLVLLAKDGKYVDDGSFDRSNFSEFKTNLYNILKDEAIEETLQILQIEDVGIKAKFYNIYFQKDNAALSEVMKNIQQFGLLYEIFKVANNEQ